MSLSFETTSTGCPAFAAFDRQFGRAHNVLNLALLAGEQFLFDEVRFQHLVELRVCTLKS